MTLNQYIKDCISRLSPIYDASESRWIVRIILESLKGWTQADILLNGDSEIQPELTDRIGRIIVRLLNHEPIQYILGETYWHGMILKVTPDVLIPRVETSELVDIITDENNESDLKILDLCTGSGCIAIALAKSLPFSDVTGVDISAAALKVAEENATGCKVNVRYIKEDILASHSNVDTGYDIIVSNPPYIADSEKVKMSRNVLDYEPYIALFVPDDDPLKFYKAISHIGIKAGKPGTRLYLEINPMHADSLADMLKSDGWDEVSIRRDMHGKERFISAKLSNK